MPKSNFHLAEGGAEVAPDGNNEIYVTRIPPDYSKHYFSVGLYTDSSCNKLVTPTAGTIEVEASDDGLQWGTLKDGTVDLAVAGYARPSMSGLLSEARVTIKGIEPVEINGKSTYFRLRTQSYI